ncbi:hypothetical protein CEXT_702591 [Caerostris extrusa]|uniref:Uncharacterized protein n=1 Tax=Caerostris extrusa TaxID=172846 RepID=A0AAV4NPC5_CAEEX|nr:hypothetical protein CEXT_702591 [Caerostris extrusa]
MFLFLQQSNTVDEQSVFPCRYANSLLPRQSSPKKKKKRKQNFCSMCLTGHYVHKLPFRKNQFHLKSEEFLQVGAIFREEKPGEFHTGNGD